MSEYRNPLWLLRGPTSLRRWAFHLILLAGLVGSLSISPVAKAQDLTSQSELTSELTDLRKAVDSIAWPLRDSDLFRALRDAELVAKKLGQAELPPLDRGRATLHLARSFAHISRAENGGKEAGESEPAAKARLRAVEILSGVAQLFANVEGDPDDPTAEHFGLREKTWADGELAHLYLDGRRPAEALLLARRAFRATTAQEDPLARYRFGIVLGRALYATGDRAGALTALRDASRLGEALRREQLNRLAEIRSGTETSVHHAEDFEGESEATRRLLTLLLEDVAQNEGSLSGEAQQSRLREIRDLVETQRSAEVENYFGDICLKDDQDGLAEAGPGALVLYPILLSERVVLLTSQNGTFQYLSLIHI